MSKRFEYVVNRIRLCAASAEKQIKELPDFVVVGDEVALEFENAWLIAQDESLDVDEEALNTMEEIFAVFALMTDVSGEDVWSEDALSSHPIWRCTRRLAKICLDILGAKAEPIGLTSTDYIKSED